MIILGLILFISLLLFFVAIYFTRRDDRSLTLRQHTTAILVTLKSNKQHWLAMCGVTFTAIIMYLLIGAGLQLPNYQRVIAQNQEAIALEAQLNNPNEVIKKMKEILAKQPESVEGWYLLGRLYFSQTKYHLAAESFAKAYTLAPDNQAVILQYAHALYFANHQQITLKIKNLLAVILEKNPKDPGVNNLLAIAAFHQKSYPEAILHWQTAIESLSPDDPEYGTTMKAIEQAKEHLTLAEIAKLRQDQQQIQHHEISVAVMLASPRKPSFKPSDTLYIYAKAVDGPTIPLAVIRKRVADLPLQVTLNYQQAMSPLYNLDQFNRIRIYVKISEPTASVSAKGLTATTSSIIDLRRQKNIQIVIQ